MKEARLPPLADDHNEISKDHQKNEADENNIQTEEIEALRILFAHMIIYAG